MKTRLPILALACTIVLFSCKKDQEEPTPPSNNGGGTNTSATPDAHLVATIFMGSTTSHFAFAVFNDPNDQSVLVGNVSLNSVQLDTSGSSYYSNPSSSTLIDLSNGQTNWTIEGGNGFTGFSSSGENTPFPFLGAITSGSTVDRSIGHVIQCGSITNVDSVEFSISGQNSYVNKTLVGTATQCTFTPAELAVLTSPSGDVSIYAFTTHDEIIGGKRIRFHREFFRNQQVSIVD